MIVVHACNSFKTHMAPSLHKFACIIDLDILSIVPYDIKDDFAKLVAACSKPSGICLDDELILMGRLQRTVRYIHVIFDVSHFVFSSISCDNVCVSLILHFENREGSDRVWCSGCVDEPIQKASFRAVPPTILPSRRHAE